MHGFAKCLTVVTVVVLTCAHAKIEAADSKSTTTISIEGMHCAACASKVARKLQSVSGATAVQADSEAGIASVKPQPKKSISPRALWDAVEAAGYKPTKLVGPSGTYTSKPKS